MNKLIRLMKNTIYLKLCSPRQLTAVVAVAGSLFSSMAGLPIALADEAVFNGNSAFLTVQPLTIDEKDGDEITLQNGVFFTAKNLVLSVLKKNSAPPVKTSSPAVVKVSGPAVIVTAYSSTPDQTDDSPFITANGTHVRDGIIAANFLPFGTKVRFPEYSGDKIYTVQDRMAKKNSHKIDIWMPTRGDALQFGVKKLAYEIVE